MTRDNARRLKLGSPWRNYELTVALAVALGESKNSLGAWHDNAGDLSALSRDCGLYQINIPARMVGTPAESRLRTDSKDPAVYEPVWDNNIDAAVALWERRGWQPWYAYKWAVFPHSWVWHRTDGVPTGPWVPTGRYLFKAIAGQMNNKIINEKDWTSEQGYAYAKSYAHHFGIADGSRPKFVPEYLTGKQIISWEYPSAPSAPPADGSGPYPS